MDKFNSTTYGTWYSPVLIIRQIINDKTRIAFRGKYYNNTYQIIISTETLDSFQTLGLSSNLDFDINKNIKFRLEGKFYHSKDKILEHENNNFSLNTNLTIKL